MCAGDETHLLGSLGFTDCQPLRHNKQLADSTILNVCRCGQCDACLESYPKEFRMPLIREDVLATSYFVLFEFFFVLFFFFWGRFPTPITRFGLKVWIFLSLPTEWWVGLQACPDLTDFNGFGPHFSSIFDSVLLKDITLATYWCQERVINT